MLPISLSRRRTPTRLSSCRASLAPSRPPPSLACRPSWPPPGREAGAATSPRAPWGRRGRKARSPSLQATERRGLGGSRWYPDEPPMGETARIVP